LLTGVGLVGPGPLQTPGGWGAEESGAREQAGPRGHTISVQQGTRWAEFRPHYDFLNDFVSDRDKFACPKKRGVAAGRQVRRMEKPGQFGENPEFCCPKCPHSISIRCHNPLPPPPSGAIMTPA
jgi:hypothetical protein